MSTLPLGNHRKNTWNFALCCGVMTSVVGCRSGVMMIHSLWLAVVLTLVIPQGGTVSGRILDREGKPLANAQISYTNIGQFSNAPDNADPILNSGTGKVYKTKTNKRGEFSMIGVAIGIYRIEIKDSSGAFVYSAKRYVGDNADATWSNVLSVDLSSPSIGDAVVRQHNSTVSKINSLTLDLHTALDAQDWNRAADLLQQLIALDPNRWQHYQNLGTIESNQSQYKDAAESFRKGVELGQKILAASPDSVQAKSDVSGMMMSEADALTRLGKLDEATALYEQAAALAPQPAMAYYHACNAQSNRGTLTSAIESCKKAIAADPNQWEFYQVLASAESGSGKSEDAIQTYEKGIQVARQDWTTHPDSVRAKTGLGQMLNAAGNFYAQQNRYDLAVQTFTESAKMSSYAAMPWFNVCATYFNMNRLADAIQACDQAIASDPAISEAYYLKASALFGEAQLQDGKYTPPPPETRTALNKYLELSPFGPHAQLVRDMLDKLDAPVQTTVTPPRPTVKKK
jgi:tetratricopeptide (TPR) repeat protein